MCAATCTVESQGPEIAPEPKAPPVDVHQTKRRAASQLPPKPDSLQIPNMSVPVAHTAHARQALSQLDTGTQSPDSESLHMSQLGDAAGPPRHGELHHEGRVSQLLSREGGDPVDQEGLERLKERLKVQQAMVQIDTRRRQWKQTVEKVFHFLRWVTLSNVI